ncbi:MAG: sugar nucleotide-binding protein [Hamadaea sp.]|uniref:SDR family oxidoreductase n=1 Tax=Hamadaea sp. TaxID=2024425 RepID=UPI0017BA8129|nr:SDR family oxidoreductase [Hamadaea sp.]NUR70392.1 sugar nucleotide-binding protein [Hamadaea sp.]NUT20552.1 sugar nucleotide-binding protein [Hamadaea sp.]
MTILLTGGSGAVGAAVLGTVPVGRPAQRIVALVHRGGVAAAAVAGDITAPRLGLAPDQYAQLTREVGTVVHCAGATEFTASAEVLRALNVDGTRHVLEFAADAGARVVFASTAFVVRRDTAAPLAQAYLETKLAAEELVRTAGLPAAIARIGVVMGDARTGRMSRFQGLHSTVDAVLRNLLPVLPFAQDAVIDALPRDVVADELLGLAFRTGDGVTDHWLTAGPAALTIGRMVELVAELAPHLGRTVHPPRFVRPALVDRVVRPAYIDPLPAPQRRKFANLMALASLFDNVPPFPTTLADPPPTRRLEEAFVATVDYLAASRGLLAA